MNSKKTCLLLLLLAMLSFGCDNNENNDFRASLAGNAEVPPVNTSATGTATFSLDEDNNVIDFDVDVSNITNVIAAHIHNGAVGVNGDIVVFLFNGPQTGTVNGNLSSGTIRPGDVTGLSFGQLVAAMRSGQAYVNVHTTQNPAGEIRGQIEVTD